MHIIDIAIRNKIAVNTNKTEYVCGNDDFIVRFDFDAEWDDFVHKTARFISNGAYADVVFSGNECAVPVHSGTNTILCGVYAGDLRTTTPALIGARKSILCGSPAPAEPTPAVFAQMMELFNANDAIRKNAEAASLSEQNAKTSEGAAAKSAEEAKRYASPVRSVNDIQPDENGNVEVPVAGENVAGKEYTIDGETVTAQFGAEVFNDYNGNMAVGMKSHAEGERTIAKGGASHAEGWETQALDSYCHSEGAKTVASGRIGSHAEGCETVSSGGFGSHSEGRGTKAAGTSQHVQGKYNIEDTAGKYAHIVGNGTSDSKRSNAHTLDWEGNAWYAGSVEAPFMILVSPNGTRFKITVDDNGALSAAAL